MKKITKQVLEISCEMGREANLKVKHKITQEERRDKVEVLNMSNYQAKFTQPLWITYFSRDNLLVDLDRLVGKERRITSSHFINQHTQCPPINCFIITLKYRIISYWIYTLICNINPLVYRAWQVSIKKIVYIIDMLT